MRFVNGSISRKVLAIVTIIALTVTLLPSLGLINASPVNNDKTGDVKLVVKSKGGSLEFKDSKGNKVEVAKEDKDSDDVIYTFPVGTVVSFNAVADKGYLAI